ncbi:MAG TPA: type II secretion system minor pseudopilin GspI [Hyphomonas sp.]|nr:type II secretion system minor pseudopilin GspI [Hyphomonas sp.]
MNDSGFSLVEVLVALAVFSISALALVQLTTDLSRNTQHLDLKALASIEADSRLARLSADPKAHEPGERNGTEMQLGADMAWSERVSETSVPGLLLAEVRISDPETRQELVRRGTLLRAKP